MRICDQGDSEWRNHTIVRLQIRKIEPFAKPDLANRFRNREKGDVLNSADHVSERALIVKRWVGWVCVWGGGPDKPDNTRGGWS